jgi:hypothetical protein
VACLFEKKQTDPLLVAVWELGHRGAHCERAPGGHFRKLGLVTEMSAPSLIVLKKSFGVTTKIFQDR